MGEAGDRPAWTTRAHALAVSCPLCGATPGDKCRGAEGQVRASPHQDRHQAAIRLGAPIAKASHPTS